MVLKTIGPADGEVEEEIESGREREREGKTYRKQLNKYSTE